MLRVLANPVLAVTAIAAPLYLWREFLPDTDFAILPLVVLAAACFAGAFRLILDPWVASKKLWLRDQSVVAPVMSGKLRATVLAALYAGFATAILGWKSVQVDESRLGVLLGAAYLAGVAFPLLNRFMRRQFHEPFAAKFSTSAAGWMLALLFALPYSVWTYTTALYPDLRDTSLANAMALGRAMGPERDTLLANVVSALLAVDMAKIWIVEQVAHYPLVGWLFCLDDALAFFTVCHVGIVLTQWADRLDIGTGRESDG